MKPTGPTYDLLGYKRLIVDYHFSDFAPDTLINASADAYVRACASLGVDSVLVYAKDHWGHCYYATPNHPHHPNAPHDLFGQVLTGLGEEGITGYAYFSVGWDEHAARTHPDWVMRAADGAPIRIGWSLSSAVSSKWTYLCLNSPYRRVALAQIEEIVAGYDFPAIFLDILFLNPQGAVCHCQHCQRCWLAEHDGPLPTAHTPAYLDFAIHTLDDFYRQVKAIITASDKCIQTTHNYGPPYDDDDYLAYEVNSWGRNFWRTSALAKIVRAEARGREVELIGHRFNGIWDFTTKGWDQMRWEAATVLAHNCALMWVDQPHMDGSFDTKALAAMADAYRAVDDLAPHVRGSAPYAEIALLYAQCSTLLDTDQELDFVGAYRLLSELHWPFDVLAEDHLTIEQLRAFRLLIIPNIRHLSPEAVTAVRQYVHEGGRLLFTYETATTDLDGGLLSTSGFGFIDQRVRLDHQVSFLLPSEVYDLTSTHLRVTEMLAFQPAADIEVHAVHMEPGIHVTPESWSSHNVAPGAVTEQPAVVAGDFGSGRYVYAAPRLFAESMRQGLAALDEFLNALLSGLCAPAIWVDAPGPIEATFNRRGDELIVCLVNPVIGRPALGGVMLLGDTPGNMAFETVVPVHDVRVHLRDLPVEGAEDSEGRPLLLSIVDNETIVTLKRLDAYAVVRVSLTQ